MDHDAQTARRPLRVVYVAGTGRSGTTLLGNALGSLPGATSVGEVKYGFRHTLARGGFCGCRLPLPECPVWGPALVKTFGSFPSVEEALAFDRRLDVAVRTRRVPGWLAGHDTPEVRDLVDTLGRLTVNLAAAAGAEVVVDSSKLPGYAALLARSPLLDVHLVHAVRDPRAVAWSWQRRTASHQVSGFEQRMEHIGPTKASLMWLESSVSTSLVARRTQRDVTVVRYEDLVTRPAEELARVARAVGLEPDVSFVDGTTLQLRPSHAVAGNPARVRSGPLVLARDDEWDRHMSSAQRALVSAITAPRRRTHGY